MASNALKKLPRLASSSLALNSRILSVPASNVGLNKRELSQRSWNLVRYHEDLSEAIKFNSNANAPVIHRPGDVMVRVLASSINPLDIAMTRGYGNVLLSLSNLVTSTGIDRLTNDPLPLTLGRDFVGQIVSRGNSVSLYKPGDIVWGTVMPYENGAHADFVVIPDSQIAHKPQNLSNVEAAALPYVGLTAWAAISTFGELNSTNTVGKKVLVLGGSGGVGCFSIQLLKAWGANVTATCSAESMPWLAENCHPDRCVDYAQMEDFLATTTERYDFILDASTPEAARRNYELLSAQAERNRQLRSKSTMANRKQTRLLDDRTMFVTLNSPLLRNFDRYGPIGGVASTLADAITDSLSGFRNGLNFRWAYYLPNPKALVHIGDLVERGVIRPFTTRVYDFDRALDAYKSMQQRGKVGKAVLSNGE